MAVERLHQSSFCKYTHAKSILLLSEIYANLIKQFPQFPEYWSDWGNLLYKLGDYNLAFKQFSLTATQYLIRASASTSYPNNYSRTNDISAALYYYNRSLSVVEDHFKNPQTTAIQPIITAEIKNNDICSIYYWFSFCLLELHPTITDSADLLHLYVFLFSFSWAI